MIRLECWSGFWETHRLESLLCYGILLDSNFDLRTVIFSQPTGNWTLLVITPGYQNSYFFNQYLAKVWQNITSEYKSIWRCILFTHKNWKQATKPVRLAQACLTAFAAELHHREPLCELQLSVSTGSGVAVLQRQWQIPAFCYASKGIYHCQLNLNFFHEKSRRGRGEKKEF